MERNEKRDELQSRAAEILKETKRLACMWATGTGKSGVVMRFLKDNPGLRTLILVPETNNIDNWKDEFDKFGVPLFGTDIICYASLHKYVDTAWDLLVIDEAPHADTELKTEQLSTIKADYVLALGAVITDEEMLALKALYGEFHISRIGFGYAIKSGLLPAPQICVLHMKLDNTKRLFAYKDNFYTEKQMYDILNKEVSDAYHDYCMGPMEWKKNRMNQAGIRRKRFLGARKHAAVERVCQALDRRGMRYLCFCSSIKEAKELGKSNAFTSMTPKSAKTLERFNNREINSLFVVGKLIEGQNLNSIDCGVLGQIGNSDRITVQSIGRIMRSENPRIFIPVFDDTKDDGFLYTVTNNIPKEYIKHYNF